MRWIALALLVGCVGSELDQCPNPCDGAVGVELRYLCDGGPCLPGESLAEPYYECRCQNGRTLVFHQAASCAQERATWNVFYAANCR
jgi:hypothetical protein